VVLVNYFRGEGSSQASLLLSLWRKTTFYRLQKNRHFEDVPKNLALAGIVITNYSGIVNLFKAF
jgi:hypothetical protein